MEQAGQERPYFNRLLPICKDYDESALAQTGFDNLGSGEPTKLYDSTNENVINTHFKWMNQYGIDSLCNSEICRNN